MAGINNGLDLLNDGPGIERHSTEINLFDAGPNKAFIDLHRPLERDLIRARRTNAVLGRYGAGCLIFLPQIHGWVKPCSAVILFLGLTTIERLMKSLASSVKPVIAH